MLGREVVSALILFSIVAISIVSIVSDENVTILVEVGTKAENITFPNLVVNGTSPLSYNESGDDVAEQTTLDPTYLAPLDPVSLEALIDAVTSHLAALVYDGLVRTNASLVDKAGNFSSCLQIVRQTKDDCFACMNERCQIRADECTENPEKETETTESPPKIDLTDKLKCIISPSLCALEGLDKKVEKEITRAGQNVVKEVKRGGEFVGDALEEIRDSAEKLAKSIGKGLEKAGKAIGGAAQNLGEGLEDAGKAAIKEIGKGLENTAKTLADGAKDTLKHAGKQLENAGKAAEHIAKNIGKNIEKELANTKKAAEKIVKDIGDDLKNAGKNIENAAKDAILNPAKDVLKNIGRVIPPIRIRMPKVHLPRIRLPRIRLPRVSRGWRRRRRTSEPTCEELADDSASACRFYQSTCDVCSSFGQPDSEQSVEDMLVEFCGEDILETYKDVTILANRLSTLIDLYHLTDVFTLQAVSFDPVSYGADGYSIVHVTFVSLNQTSAMYLQQPTLPHAAQFAGPMIAEEIYKKLIV